MRGEIGVSGPVQSGKATCGQYSSVSRPSLSPQTFQGTWVLVMRADNASSHRKDIFRWLWALEDWQHTGGTATSWGGAGARELWAHCEGTES
jgi:hypothetical protein